MRKEDTVRLDTHYLARRIEVRRVKLWWLAEQVGVDKKTVGRWVSGKVKRLARANAAALAGALACPVDALTASDEADVLATKEEQRVAADLVQQQDLMGLLSPSENWQLAESIIKATLQPDLPLRQLGRLYNLLSIAAWRQGHYPEAEAHAARARAIGEQIRDPAVLVKAQFNQATIDSLLGRHAASLAGYAAALTRPEGFEDRRSHASALFNIGMVYRDFARFDDARAAIAEAAALFADARLEYNLAIAWTGAGILETEAGRFDEARAALDRAASHARRGNVARYQAAVPLYQGDVESLAGDPAAGRALVEQGAAALRAFPVHDLAVHELLVRARRRAGDHSAARAALAEGLTATRDFPTPRALLLEEAARLGDERTHRAAANDLWVAQGLTARRRASKIVEYGNMWASAKSR